MSLQVIHRQVCGGLTTPDQVLPSWYTQLNFTSLIITSQVLLRPGVQVTDNTCLDVACDKALLTCVPTLCDVTPTLLTSLPITVVIKVTLHICVTLRTCLAGSQVRWQDGVTTVVNFHKPVRLFWEVLFNIIPLCNSFNFSNTCKICCSVCSSCHSYISYISLLMFVITLFMTYLPVFALKYDWGTRLFTLFIKVFICYECFALLPSIRSHTP